MSKNNFKFPPSPSRSPFDVMIHSIIMLPSKCTAQSKVSVSFLCSISGFLCQHGPSVLHTHLYLHITLSGRTMERNLANFKQSNFLSSKEKFFPYFRLLSKDLFYTWNKLLFFFADEAAALSQYTLQNIDA